MLEEAASQRKGLSHPTTGKVLQEGQEASGHMASTGRKQRVECWDSAGSPPPFLIHKASASRTMLSMLPASLGPSYSRLCVLRANPEETLS